MKFNLAFLLLFFGFLHFQFSAQQSTVNIVYDSTIEKEVELNITDSKFSKASDELLIYENKLYVDYFVNDTLTMSTKNDEKLIFKSFFYKQNNILVIDGAYGMFGGFGFSVKINGNQAQIFHLVASDEFPSFSLNKNDSLEYRIEVPCHNTKITLSKTPILKSGEIVYGKVEFESGNYYERGLLVNDKEIEPRKKMRVKMIIYFKSNYFDIENFQ